MTSNSVKRVQTLVLESSFTLRECKAHAEAWKNVVTAQELYIDASKIREIDQIGLELLAQTIQDIRTHQGSVHWVPTPSVRFVRNVERAGLRCHFGIDSIHQLDQSA